jgi:hypothetical protein
VERLCHSVNDAIQGFQHKILKWKCQHQGTRSYALPPTELFADRDEADRACLEFREGSQQPAATSLPRDWNSESRYLQAIGLTQKLMFPTFALILPAILLVMLVPFALQAQGGG